MYKTSESLLKGTFNITKNIIQNSTTALDILSLSCTLQLTCVDKI